MNIIRRRIAELKASNNLGQGQAARPADAVLNHYLIRAGNRMQDRIPINKDLFIIGRSQSADHIVMDSGVSRIHMEFIRVQNRLAVRDLNSTNGTYINGQRIEPYAINFVNKGDHIKLAGVEYEFV
ncbi:MAG: FHA domain-containing protein, partial [Chitinophagales bacterium]